MNHETEVKIAVARRAAALMERGECRGASARDANGNKCLVFEREADRFCALGALARASFEIGDLRVSYLNRIEREAKSRLGRSLVVISDKEPGGRALIVATLRQLVREWEGAAA